MIILDYLHFPSFLHHLLSPSIISIFHLLSSIFFSAAARVQAARVRSYFHDSDFFQLSFFRPPFD